MQVGVCHNCFLDLKSPVYCKKNKAFEANPQEGEKRIPVKALRQEINKKTPSNMLTS